MSYDQHRSGLRGTMKFGMPNMSWNLIRDHLFVFIGGGRNKELLFSISVQELNA
jgi:hypothetical protein